MKYLKKYRIFESDDEGDEDIHPDDIVKAGHKYSWNDFKERMIYLNDVGFEFIEGTNRQEFINDEGDKCKMTNATYLVTQFSMKKQVNQDDLVSRTINFGMGFTRDEKRIYLTKWDDNLLEIHEAIASFCAHFQDCYQHLSLQHDGWLASFVIYTEVEDEIKRKVRESDIDYDTNQAIIRNIESSERSVKEKFTRVTRDKIMKNKVGESMWGSYGDIKKGFLVMPFNLSECSRQVKNRVVSNLESCVDDFERSIGRTGKVELREITEKDIDKLVEVRGDKSDKKYYMDRYLGLYGYVITFDYKKLFDKRRPSYENN